jgi:Pathogenicity locus
MAQKSRLSDLQTIPGVGPSIEKDLLDLGIRKVTDLNGKDPEKLYSKICRLRNQQIDRCLLYVFRCAVYFAENKEYDPELLKWWNWK